MEGQVEEVWIKSEQTDGEYVTHIESDPFTETVTYTEEELSPEIGNIKSEIFDDDDNEFITSTETKNENHNLRIRKRRNAGEKAWHECEECGKAFPRKSCLNRHMFMHTGEKPFECDICGLRFAQKGHVKPHKLQHTGETPYACDECDMKFMYGKSLKRHKKVHCTENEIEAGKIDFDYNESGAKFAGNQTPKTRRRNKHAGEATFECDECGKAFSRRDHLNRHIRMHTGERNFECDICGKKFAQKCHVKPHKELHNTDRQTNNSDKQTKNTDRPRDGFSCEECGKKFSWKDGLRKHKRLHVFFCPLCKINYDREVDLVGHMEERHRIATKADEG